MALISKQINIRKTFDFNGTYEGMYVMFYSSKYSKYDKLNHKVLEYCYFNWKSSLNNTVHIRVHKVCVHIVLNIHIYNCQEFVPETIFVQLLVLSILSIAARTCCITWGNLNLIRHKKQISQLISLAGDKTLAQKQLYAFEYLLKWSVKRRRKSWLCVLIKFWLIKFSALLVS